MALSNKWVLITGASSGFGEAAAHAFAREGAKLLLGARRVDRLEQVAAAARKLAHRTRRSARDVASTPSVEAFAGFVKQHTDKLDVLINNAGGAKGIDTVANGKDADWEFMMQTNVLGVLRVTRALLPMMTNNPGSSIINIGSIASRTAYEGGSAYCGAKAGRVADHPRAAAGIVRHGRARVVGRSRTGGDGVLAGALRGRRRAREESL